MSLDVSKVEEVLHKHWKIPSKLNLNELHDHAFRISVMVGQKYSHDNLRYQLSLIQVKFLKQDFDHSACDNIASDLLGASQL